MCLDQLLSHQHAICCSCSVLAQFVLPQFSSLKLHSDNRSSTFSNHFIVNRKQGLGCNHSRMVCGLVPILMPNTPISYRLYGYFAQVASLLYIIKAVCIHELHVYQRSCIV